MGYSYPKYVFAGPSTTACVVKDGGITPPLVPSSVVCLNIHKINMLSRVRGVRPLLRTTSCAAGEPWRAKRRAAVPPVSRPAAERGSVAVFLPAEPL